MYHDNEPRRNRVQASVIRLLSIGDPSHAVNYLGLQDSQDLCVRTSCFDSAGGRCSPAR